MEKRLIGSGQCPFCGKDNRVEVTEKELAGYEKWKKGEGNIQDVMPSLSASKREVLISGICLTCQESVFAEPSYDEDEDDHEPDYNVDFNSIEYDLGALGYYWDNDDFDGDQYINEDTCYDIILNHNLKTAIKCDEDGTGCDFNDRELEILKKHGFTSDTSDDDLPF